MNRVYAGLLGLFAVTFVVLPGCRFFKAKETVYHTEEDLHYRSAATRIEYADVEADCFECDNEARATPPPNMAGSDSPADFWDLNLQQVVQMALDNSKVMRDLGGTVLRSPDNARTIHDPAIGETDPRFGVEAALSAFDASFAASTYIEYNDLPLNNTFFGGGTRKLKQDLGTFQSQLSKVAATGTEFTVRNNTEYDKNNAPGNAFPSVWTMNIEAEVRHPLLLGGGIDFNRIAGPAAVPGFINGVLVARTNTDISLADFELALRDFISDVENAYWDLYFAYRDLNAKIEARDAALKTWRVVKALNETGRRGGEAEKEAQAREQYFRFQEQVENALYGRLLDGTQTNNGSSGGSFRATSGVHVAERRLRLMMGIALGDGRTIRPADEPVLAEVTFDWEDSLAESLTRRAELRRQKWLIKRLEMELEASCKFLLPTLDLVGRYRVRGLGKDLFRQHPGALEAQNPIAGLPPRTLNATETNNAFDSLNNFDFQEWQVGFELSMPLGFRRAHAAVRNAELRLARARSVLSEQERTIAHGLSDAIADKGRAYKIVATNFNRRRAAGEQLGAVQAAYEADKAPLDLVLDAQRRFAEAQSSYYQALVEYALSIKNVHLEKGSLLDYNEIFLSEGSWPHQAYEDARERASLRSRPLKLNHFLSEPTVISRGLHPQQMVSPEETDGRELIPVPMPDEQTGGKMQQDSFENKTGNISLSQPIPESDVFLPPWERNVPATTPALPVDFSRPAADDSKR